MILSGIDTLSDLREWVKENMPGAKVVEGASGIEIHTGLETSMGGYLHPIEKEGEEE